MFQKLYRHLQEINANTRQQQAHLEHTDQWAEKISNQLEELNKTIISLQKQRPHRSMQTAGLIIAGLGLVLLGMLSAYTFRLSAVTDATRQTSSASLKAFGLVNDRCQTLAGNTLDLQSRTTTLDTLVKQQAKTIVELKKLNAMSIRSIFYLQQDVAAYRREREQALVK